MLAGLYQTFVVQLRDRADARARQTPPEVGTRQLLTVALGVMAVLFFIRYFGRSTEPQYWQAILRGIGLSDWADALGRALTQGEGAKMARKVYWAGARLFAYTVIPATFAWVGLRGAAKIPLRELFGLKLSGFFEHVRIYLLMLAVVAPVVVLASLTDSFQRKYPFYRLEEGESVWPWLIAWELLYAMQFLALEMFYRGFIVQGLSRRLGYAAIFFMMVPYMMIHFGKPMPECLGSIIAGFVLGTMSLKSGAIWFGAVLHVLVAWGMDFLSLWHQGHLS